jgi:hypothetical protein
MQDMRELFDGQSGGSSGVGKSDKKLLTAAPTTDLPA